MWITTLLVLLSGCSSESNNEDFANADTSWEAFRLAARGCVARTTGNGLDMGSFEAVGRYDSDGMLEEMVVVDPPRHTTYSHIRDNDGQLLRTVGVSETRSWTIEYDEHGHALQDEIFLGLMDCALEHDAYGRLLARDCGMFRQEFDACESLVLTTSEGSGTVSQHSIDYEVGCSPGSMESTWFGSQDVTYYESGLPVATEGDQASVTLWDCLPGE